MRVLLAILFVSISTITGFSQNNELFERGERDYKAENFQGAIDNWMQILQTKNHSAEVYFNLGNAHYKLNNIGPSIYYYEKALRLAPTDLDIKTNLAFAENAKVDAIEPLPKSFFSKWYESVAGLFTFDGWAVATVLLWILFVGFFLAYYFSFSERKKRLLFVCFSIAFILAIVSLIFSFRTYNDFTSNREAILFSETVEVKNGPSIGSDTSFVLHEGTKVKVLDEDDSWIRVQAANGKDGWILASDLKEL